VLSVIAFAVVDTVDQAVELANSSDYSLTASLWTRNVHSALDVASRIRAGKTHFKLVQWSHLSTLSPEGCTNINGSTIHSEPAAPLGGLGYAFQVIILQYSLNTCDSGATGYGRFDIANFTDKRTIIIHPPHREYPLVG
jgi:hypothetical protein